MAYIFLMLALAVALVAVVYHVATYRPEPEVAVIVSGVGDDGSRPQMFRVIAANQREAVDRLPVRLGDVVNGQQVTRFTITAAGLPNRWHVAVEYVCLCDTSPMTKPTSTLAHWSAGTPQPVSTCQP